MRVEVEIDADCKEQSASLHIARLTSSIQTAIDILEKEGSQNLLTARLEGKIYVIDPEGIVLVRTEGRELVLYNRRKERYILSRPLYELQELLGSQFIRISKSAIINLRHIHHVEASFNGTMEVVMENGLTELITRSYRTQFKERLGV